MHTHKRSLHTNAAENPGKHTHAHPMTAPSPPNKPGPSARVPRQHRLTAAARPGPAPGSPERNGVLISSDLAPFQKGADATVNVGAVGSALDIVSLGRETRRAVPSRGDGFFWFSLRLSHVAGCLPFSSRLRPSPLKRPKRRRKKTCVGGRGGVTIGRMRRAPSCRRGND